MGYRTDFLGTLQFNKEVTEELKNFINGFSRTRKMRRSNDKIKEIFPDWEDKCYKGSLGIDGEYFIGGSGYAGQEHDSSILNYNYPPSTQPGLWCQWIINDDNELEWDGGEKFYNYTEWLEYLIENFFKPGGYILNGTIHFQGEDDDDFGEIIAVNNNVSIDYGIHVQSLSEIDDNSLLKELANRGYNLAEINKIERGA